MVSCNNLNGKLQLGQVQESLNIKVDNELMDPRDFVEKAGYVPKNWKVKGCVLFLCSYGVACVANAAWFARLYKLSLGG